MVPLKVKGKGLFVTWCRLRGGVEVQLYTCSIAALYQAGWSTPHPAHFTVMGTPHYPLYMRLGGAVAGVDGYGEEKISHMEFH
jgi:hypothetical protein